jgi:WD40 repeat protein
MKRIAVATQSGSICLLDAEGNLLFHLPGLRPKLQVLQFSPDGKLLAGAGSKGLTVWDLDKRDILVTMPKSTGTALCGPCFAANGQMIAVGNYDGTVEVWSLVRKELVGNWKAHNSVSGLALMPDGNRLVTVSWDNQARLWDVASRRELLRFGRALNAYSCVALSPDGQRIAAGTPDSLIRI